MIDSVSIQDLIVRAGGIALAATAIIKPLVDTIRLYFEVKGRNTLYVAFGLGQAVVWLLMVTLGTPLTLQTAGLMILSGILAALGSKGLTETQRKADSTATLSSDLSFIDVAEGLAPPVNLDDHTRAIIAADVQQATKQALDNYFSPADSPVKD